MKSDKNTARVNAMQAFIDAVKAGDAEEADSAWQEYEAVCSDKEDYEEEE